MKKDMWLAVLLVVLVGLAVVVVRQQTEIGELKQRVERLSVRPVVAAKPVIPKPPKREPAPLPVATSVEPVAAPASPNSSTTNNPLAGLASMMKDPAMKEMIRAQQKLSLDMMYGSLAKNLNLSTDQSEAFNKLLLDRQMASVDAGFAVMNGSASERKQALDETKAIKAEYDQKIQDLLGPADYQTFKQYEQSLGERMQVQMFKAALPGELALTDQQESELIAVMTEERTALPATALLNTKTPDPAQLTEQNIAEALKQLEQLQSRYADRAAGILTPAQLEQFTKWQQQWDAMQTMGLKMASQMFGNKPTPPANP